MQINYLLQLDTLLKIACIWLWVAGDAGDLLNPQA